VRYVSADPTERLVEELPPFLDRIRDGFLFLMPRPEGDRSAGSGSRVAPSSVGPGRAAGQTSAQLAAALGREPADEVGEGVPPVDEAIG
jgi:hypothetical protein